MWLFADSGSTKTEWRLVNKLGEYQWTTATSGLNPYFLTKEEIAEIICRDVHSMVDDIERVFFYGAGCGIATKAHQVKNAISEVFPSALIEVEGDILAAARSLLQGEKGIACILGTGANSCVYDGSEIAEMVPSLGYLLSDWGSGTVMGKDLVGLVLQRQLPTLIIDDFFDTYGLTPVEVLDKIYNKPLPNRFLASFSPFLLKYAEEPALRHIIMTNFSAFLDYYVLRYPFGISDRSISIVGSVAFHYKKYFEEVADRYDIEVNKLIQHPMDGLVQFHCETIQV